MTLAIRTSLVLCVAICAFAPRWSMAEEECAYAFAAAVNIQILDKSTQMPIDDYLNNWNGALFVREGKLMDIELWGYRVDLRFRNVGEQRYEVTVLLQERTSPSDVPPVAGVFHHPNATYKELNSTALKYEVVSGTPLVARPDIGEVTLDLTVYSYPNET